MHAGRSQRAGLVLAGLPASGLSGITLLAVGVTGDYIARIYDELKARPLYIVDTLRNFAPERLAALPGRRRSSWRPRSDRAAEPAQRAGLALGPQASGLMG